MAQQTELFELLKSGGKIVSSASCTVLEISEACSCNRMYVDKEGFGFVYFPSKQLTEEQKVGLIVNNMAQQTHKHLEKIIEFIGIARYDQWVGGYIWGNKLCQYMSVYVSIEEAAEFQDELGKFIAEAINEKIEKIKQK